jgi:hypothetical protein
MTLIQSFAGGQTGVDRGACFFSAKYDPATKQLYDLEVNGVGWSPID